MPIYTLRNNITCEEYDVTCSYSELQTYLANEHLEQVLKFPNSITQAGSTLSKTDDGWKEVLSRVKNASGRGHTVKD